MNNDPLTLGQEVTFDLTGQEVGWPNGNISTLETRWVMNTERAAREGLPCQSGATMLGLLSRSTDRQILSDGSFNPCPNVFGSTCLSVGNTRVDRGNVFGPVGNGITAFGQMGGLFIGGNPNLNLSGPAVRGISSLGNGVEGRASAGFAGVLGQSTARGIIGRATIGVGVLGEGRIGVEGRSSPSGPFVASFAGLFDGPVGVTGDFTVFSPGVKSAAVPHPDGSHRRLYSLESPESWFEDFGRGEMVRGQARVELDSDYAALVDLDNYYVFLTPEGDCKGLYVSDRKSTSFKVREQQEGTSSLTFSYRVVAKRKDVLGERLETVAELPPPRELEVPQTEQEWWPPAPFGWPTETLEWPPMPPQERQPPKTAVYKELPQQMKEK